MKYDRSDSPRRLAQKHGVSLQAIYQNQQPRPDPECNEDGYPTEATLELIRKWKVTSNFAIKDLLSYVSLVWHWGFVSRSGGKGKDRWIFVDTGGWSGNESLIRAMKDNRIFWLYSWMESHRGGGYKFALYPLDEKPVEGNQDNQVRRPPTVSGALLSPESIKKFGLP